MDRGYINARVRGMRSTITHNDFLFQLIESPDVKSIVTSLEKSPFREDIEKASLTYSGINCIEQALRQNITRNYNKLFSLVKGEHWESYFEIFLSKWDISNLKTIIRAKKIHASPDEVLECLVPAGLLDEATLIELNLEPDVRSVIDLLATWRIKYAAPLTKTMKDIQESKNYFLLEYSLDHFYYNHALSLLQDMSYDSRVMLSLLMKEIDLINLKSLLILSRDRIPAGDADHIFIEGGKYTKKEEFTSILAKQSTDLLVNYCKKAGHGLFLDLTPESLAAGRVSYNQREIDRFLISSGVKCVYLDPLSIGIPLSYLWQKLNEITNIRVVAWCKETGVPNEQVKEELVYV